MDLNTPPTRWVGDLRESVGRISMLAQRAEAAKAYASRQPPVPAVAQLAVSPEVTDGNGVPEIKTVPQ